MEYLIERPLEYPMKYLMILIIVILAAIILAALITRARRLLLAPASQFANIQIDEMSKKYGGRRKNNRLRSKKNTKLGQRNEQENNYGCETRGNLRIKNLSAHPRSRSEADVIKYLEELTGDKFPTVYPDWLVWKGRALELDGFNGKIALEFSGPLHTKWTPSMEPYVDYFERIVRDVVKIRLCRKHKIHLIIVDASLPSRHWRNYVKSRLYDIGFYKEKPIEYINEQVAQPFRNPQIEAELGLEVEMRAAMKL